MSDDFLRTSAHPARNDLPPADAGALGPVQLRRACAAALSVPEDALLLGEDPDALVALVVRTAVDADERVAVFQPCPEGHLNAVLSAEARYVDCGRDLSWAPRMDALELVALDGAVGVIIAAPNSPVDGGDEREISARMVEICAEGAVRFILVDRRHDRGMCVSEDRKGMVQLVALPRQGEPPVHALVGPSQWIAALARMRSESDVLEGALAARWSAPLPDLVGALGELGLEAESCAEGAWLQLLGTPAHELARRLGKHGFEVRVSPHHTWREGLVVTSRGSGEGI